MTYSASWQEGIYLSLLCALLTKPPPPGARGQNGEEADCNLQTNIGGLGADQLTVTRL